MSGGVTLTMSVCPSVSLSIRVSVKMGFSNTTDVMDGETRLFLIYDTYNSFKFAIAIIQISQKMTEI